MKVSFCRVLLPGPKKLFLLDGEFDETELVDILAHNWVDYRECHHCPKWPGDCVHIKKNPKRPERSVEIRCGVGVSVIANVVSRWFSRGVIEESDCKKEMLLSLYQMCQFSMDASVEIARLTNKNWFESESTESAAHTFGRLVSLRDHLNRLGYYGSSIDSFSTKSLLVMVEGETEQFFLQNYVSLSNHFHRFDSVTVETYGGGGNAGHNRIPLLLNIKKKEGYVCCLQSDLDGKSENQKINSLIKNGALSKDTVFEFKWDFESSFPKEWVWEWLAEFEHILDVSKSRFVEQINDEASVISQVKSKYGFDITPFKTKLCERLTVKLITLELQHKGSEYHDFEIYRFLDFVKRMSNHCRMGKL